MRALYIPLTSDDWAEHFINQAGHGLDGFKGIPYQRGNGIGSFFKGLFRMVLPFAKTIGKAVGSQALSTGVDIASDLVKGANVKKTIKTHGRKGAAILLDNASTHLAKKRKRNSLKQQSILD